MATPMMEQYSKIKKMHEDAILLFRLGDFYEMFGEDALKASKLLDITLTSRNKGDSKIPMCGVPYHAVENYIARLTKQGEKVAVCDQTSDPNLPGIVERKVTKIITPGTTLNDSILDNKSNNYLISIVKGDLGFGFAYADITTGDFAAAEVESEKDLFEEIAKLSPSECILEYCLNESEFAGTLKAFFENTYFFPYETYKNSEELLKSHFKVSSLSGFGFKDNSLAAEAAGFLLSYLLDTQKNDLKHINKLTRYSTGEYMPLDESTMRNLEITSTMRDRNREGSLISIIDNTKTAMGGRKLKFHLTHPLVSINKIKERLESVNELTKNEELLSSLTDELKNISDIERIISRLSLGSGNARDLISLKNSLKKISELKKYLKEANSVLLKNLYKSFDELSSLTNLIEKAIIEEPPAKVTEGGMIKDGYNTELDELKTISREGKNFIKNLQKDEIKRTGINSLKVKYNKVFGYYIEVSKANLDMVPDNYIRKQTLVNAERYITPELKSYEEKILNAEEKIYEIEYRLFNEILNTVIAETDIIQKNANIIALVDVLCSHAITAKSNNYCMPDIKEEDKIKINAGRHPVVEQMTFSRDFIPNDIILDNSDNSLLLITGPNMGGKSTILRQTALIVLLAHTGSFVPADSARICLVDRIFTRVGASDNLIKGQSTFMVEMQEAANILNNATSKSLIILDEIGRGTSTYDGVSIAWAITEYIHNKLRAKTLFASHYHELISVVSNLPRAQNYCVSVKEKEGHVIFLYKLEKGGIDKSYGIEVAKIAGIPEEVLEKAKYILNDLEENVVDKNIKKTVTNPHYRIPENQMDLFGNAEIIKEFERNKKGLNKIKEELDRIDINNLTPLEALKKLDELKRKKI